MAICGFAIAAVMHAADVSVALTSSVGAAVALVVSAGFVTSARLRRKFGTSVCHLETLPGVIGGWFKATVEAHFPRRPPAGVAIVLTNTGFRPDPVMMPFAATRAGALLERGMRRVYWRTSEMIDAAALRPDASGRVRIPVRFWIPPDVPHGPASGPMADAWTLELYASFPGLDYHAEFLVPVYATDRAPADEQRAEL